MELALTEARAGLGSTHPNPSVGAVVVRDGVVLGAGHTQPPGGPHAEVMAIEAARRAGPRREEGEGEREGEKDGLGG